MVTKAFAQVRGSVIRVTKLDACGAPVSGASSVVTSKRVSTVSIDEVSEDGTNIRERNFGDELIIVDDSFASVIGYSVDADLMGVDPALVTLLTGQPLVTNANGDIVGFDAQTGIDLSGFGFSLEVWSRIAGSGACDATGQRQWGYTVFPFIKGGRLGGFSFENGAVKFSIKGAQTRDGNSWGVGPFNVDRGATGASEAQTVTISGAPTGGTFTLSFRGASTAPLAYNSTSAQVASALNALGTIVAAGGVTTSGGPLPTTGVVVTFTNKGDYPQIVATSALTGGTAPAAAVATTTAGSNGTPVPLNSPLSANTHYRNMIVTLDPPAAVTGAQTLP